PACLQARLAGKRDDGAVGKGAAEACVERASEAVAVRQEDDDGDDPPRDAKHRQGCSETVMVEAKERFADDLAEHRKAAPMQHNGCARVYVGLSESSVHVHISNRRASTGGSSAARRAG